ncbi:hypothetical protein EMIHUDRAFT_222940 [Emiliania huxleyi CCMP1516]|uniref:Plus3 domain-containing protein n=2 Tax=Emiliania huxleyi TaxID=2903 RepID=A0A0D3KWH1_EMIH1|nr:hypothetical protein EMIHUDRAFT_222940 [Emiliania huxleyi CCMP1516]EOD40106.1 hypothetical protein EMIHUDRAFT_222940 [Emiliania huxleyi CCMP1516]|eukprot:XP_005792535.1 hypothetical protein EMIHUDRAFT_222940 [Emiliania huxleyi CCMP1516]
MQQPRTLGKQIRPVGGGKQIRPAGDDEEDEFGQWDGEGDEEEDRPPAAPAVPSAPPPVGKVGKALAVGVGMGKMAKPVGVGMGKVRKPVGIGKGKMAKPVGVGMGKGARAAYGGKQPAASADPMEGFGGEGAGFEAAADPPTLERIRLTRNKLELWLLEPFFERVLPGCLVRIGIGQQSSGRPVYKVAEVLGVKDGFKPYMMGKAKTTKRLELAIGSAKKAFAMNFVSNQNFEVQELEKYRRSLKEAGGVDRWPSQRAVDQKAEELRKCKDYDYTEEEINAMVAEKKKLGLTKGRAAADKATLAMDLLAAREGDEETRKQLEAEQKKLEARQASEKRLQEQREGKAFAIKDINMRNRAFELSVARTAGERAKAQRAGDAPSVKDPFARIENRGTNYYTIGKAAEPATAAAEGAGPSSAAPSAPELAIDVSAPAEPHADSGISPGFRELIATPRPGSNAELPPAERAAHAVDIDIDIDIDAPVASVPRLPTVVRGAPPLQPPSDAPRNTLSVSDYKRRMGIL